MEYGGMDPIVQNLFSTPMTPVVFPEWDMVVESKYLRIPKDP